MQSHQRNTICLIGAIYYEAMLIVINYALLSTDYLYWLITTHPILYSWLDEKRSNLAAFSEFTSSTFLKFRCNKNSPKSLMKLILENWEKLATSICHRPQNSESPLSQTVNSRLTALHPPNTFIIDFWQLFVIASLHMFTFSPILFVNISGQTFFRIYSLLFSEVSFKYQSYAFHLFFCQAKRGIICLTKQEKYPILIIIVLVFPPTVFTLKYIFLCVKRWTYDLAMPDEFYFLF